MAIIAGVGIHKFGRFPSKSWADIAREAVEMSLRNANMKIADIQIAFCSNSFLNFSTVGVKVIETLGRTGISVIDVDAACAAGVASLKLAKLAVDSGQCDVALAFGVEKMPRGFMDPRILYPAWMAHMGLCQNPMYWAMNAKRHMHDYGTTIEQIAKVSVKNHENGTLNPFAMYQTSMTIEDVLNSPLVCDPIRLYMLCSPDEGAASVVVCSEKVANMYTKKPIKILSCVHKVSKFPLLQVNSYCASPSGNPPATMLAAEEAYEIANTGPDAIDIAEVQDTDAFCEIEAYEHLGFCKIGEGGMLIEQGVTERNGKLPVNVSGGLISKGEPVGASHLGQINELVTQLRGEAGERQVPNIKTALAHVVGNLGHVGVTILRKEW